MRDNPNIPFSLMQQRYTPEDLRQLDTRFFGGFGLLLLYYFSFVLQAVFMFGQEFNMHGPQSMLFLMAVGIAAIVLTLMLLHKCWAVIPSQWRRTTPGRAAGFLLIPYFNLYWAFAMPIGYRVDANRLLEACGTSRAKISLWSLVLVLGYPFVAMAAQFVIMLLMMATLPGMPEPEAASAFLKMWFICVGFYFPMFLFAVIFAWQMRRAAKAIVRHFIEHPDDPLLRPVAAPRPPPFPRPPQSE